METDIPRNFNALPPPPSSLIAVGTLYVLVRGTFFSQKLQKKVIFQVLLARPLKKGFFLTYAYMSWRVSRWSARPRPRWRPPSCPGAASRSGLVGTGYPSVRGVYFFIFPPPPG